MGMKEKPFQLKSSGLILVKAENQPEGSGGDDGFFCILKAPARVCFGSCDDEESHGFFSYSWDPQPSCLIV